MSFRHWCKEKWFDYISECQEYGLPPVLDANQYFSKYKYWLKREYRHQNGKTKI